MEYFIANTCENLTYVSGAPDPGKLILNVDGIPFYPQIWRINSYYDSNFKLRIGGHFHIDHPEWGKDSKGNSCSCEIAGFGITGNAWGPFVHGKRSFGIRRWGDGTGSGLYKGKGQFAAGAVVYGK